MDLGCNLWLYIVGCCVMTVTWTNQMWQKIISWPTFDLQILSTELLQTTSITGVEHGCMRAPYPVWWQYTVVYDECQQAAAVSIIILITLMWPDPCEPVTGLQTMWPRPYIETLLAGPSQRNCQEVIFIIRLRTIRHYHVCFNLEALCLNKMFESSQQ